MTYTQNYVIAGGRGANPASLSVNMEPVKLTEGMGIAVKSIAYGEVYNIGELNNSFMMQLKELEKTNLVNAAENSLAARDVRIQIRNGRYNRTEQILTAIMKEINGYCHDIGLQARCSSSSTQGKFIVTFPSELKVIYTSEETPLTLIEALVIGNTISAYNIATPEWAEMGFMYLNIIKNSYINGHRSRLLSVFPIHSRKGYSFYEFSNPTYVPIEVREFSEISITLRNIKGHNLRISDMFDTIVTLHVKPLEK